jgi:hypothetical protein
MFTSFRRHYTIPVKNAIRRTDTLVWTLRTGGSAAVPSAPAVVRTFARAPVVLLSAEEREMAGRFIGYPAGDKSFFR